MIYGYARVSTNHQIDELQINALKAVGCQTIVSECGSGRKKNRPLLNKLINTMTDGDELVVWKLDRMGRNTLHVLLLFNELKEKEINFKSITDGVDLNTASGRYNFRNILSAAQYESDLNSERTLAGLAAAKAKGIKLGRRPKFTEADWIEMERMLLNGIDRKTVIEKFKVGASTLYRKFPSKLYPPSFTT